MNLEAKKILIGITGSIAAYKIAHLTRLLVKEKAEVRIVMTTASQTFITPLTLATLSKNPVLSQFEADQTGVWNNHVELGLWADLILIAPASANTLAKMAHGICDSLLLATYLSARCPVMLAPAMDLDMFLHPATQQNLQILQSFGHKIIEPETGELASGLFGKGRMAEPEQIIEILSNFFAKKAILEGKKVLLTAGPTREALDPVRFISNHSSGKMGYALAEALAEAGAKVCLVSGAVNLKPQHSNIELIKVVSAQEMYESVIQNIDNQDIIIHAAAVADYTPSQVSDTKIKKNEATFVLELTKTQDIAAEVGKRLHKNQLHVGFALETNNEIQNAQGKLERKNFDLIVLNSLQDAGAGFGHDTNKITLIDKKGIFPFELKSKTELAAELVSILAEKWKEKNT